MSIEQATLDNSAAYLKGWLSRLHDDPRMIVFAGVAAEKAIDYISGKEDATMIEEANTSVEEKNIMDMIAGRYIEKRYEEGFGRSISTRFCDSTNNGC